MIAGAGRWWCHALALATASAFVAIAGAAVIAQGVCCADDGFYAAMAKNVAAGMGFVSVLQPDNSAFVPRLDPWVAGPTMVLPTAALVWVLGNQYWVPGLTVCLLWILPLTASALLLRPLVDKASLSLATAAFFALAYALFPYHFEQWYALFGEVPTAAFILLAVLTWASRPTDARWLVLAGATFSIAILAKALAAMWAVGFLGVAILTYGFDRTIPTTSRSTAWRRVAWLCAGLLGPLAAFESWKLLALGRGRYIKLQETIYDAVQYHGVADTSRADLWTRATTADAILADRFQLPIVALLLVAAAAVLLLWRRGPVIFRRVGPALLAGMLAHAAWWLGVSTGHARYMSIPVVIVAILISLSVATARRPSHLVAPGVLVLAVLMACLGGRLLTPLDLGESLGPAARNRHGLEVTRYLDQHASGRTVFTQWWAMAAALEYQSSNRIRFQPFGLLPQHPAKQPFYVVLDDRFLAPDDLRFIDLAETCGDPKVDLTPYRVFYCPVAPWVQ